VIARYFEKRTICTCKGKARPITAYEDPEEEQMYSPTLPSTSTLDGGGWSTPHPAALPPGKTRVYPRAGLDGYGNSRPPTGIPSPDRPRRVCKMQSVNRMGLPSER
jgi:hypothetical protein